MRFKKLLVCAASVLLASTAIIGGGAKRFVNASENEANPEASVTIDSKNFPDDVFRAYVKNQIDANNDGVLSKSEIANTEEIYVEIEEEEIMEFDSDELISSLKGIEYFTSLKRLYCGGNRITSLDVSKNTQLESLNCSRNQLKSLDVSKNLKLETLSCGHNQLTSLSVSKNTALWLLECVKNKISKLDVSKNLQLKTFYCYDNQLTSLDVSKNTKLTTLMCNNNSIKTLDVSKNTLLEYFSCRNNQLTKLDVSKNTKLWNFDCANNKLVALDVSKNTELFQLYCNGNQLTSLNLKANVQVAILNCNNNKLTSLDLSKNTALNSLTCNSNQLTKIDLTKNAGLQSLECAFNKIGQLDLSNCEDLLKRIKENGLYKDNNGKQYRSDRRDAESGQMRCFFLIDATVKTTPKLFDPIGSPTKTPTKKPTATPTPAPSTGSIGDFVERLYTVALGRASEKAGKEYWIAEITNGNKTGADCGLFFLTSEEFNNRKLSVENFVETLYKTFFGRASEANGKKYWVGQLKSGAKSRADVIWGFIDSTEWCNICADYGVKSGAPSAKAERASKNAINFATRLYTCCLGRKAEEGGLKYWSLALTNLEQTGCSAAREFFTGPEFTSFKTSPEEYVRRLYTTFMDRNADEGEITYWASKIRNNEMSRFAVLQFFGQSQEFTNICAKYGIDRGTI